MTRMRLHDNGTFDILDGRRAVFSAVTAGVAYRTAEGERQYLQLRQRSGENALQSAEGPLALELQFHDTRLVLRVSNQGKVPIRLDALDVLDCDVARGGKFALESASNLVYLHHGWQSWSQTAVRAMTAPEQPFPGDDFSQKHLPYGAAAPDERTSDAFMLLARRGQEEAVLLGFETGARQFSQIRCRVENDHVVRLCAVAYADGVPLAPGAVFESETLSCHFGPAGDLYAEYARRAAQALPRRGAHKALQGWCTWYYFFGENSAEDLRANLAMMKARQLPFELVLIDDGYETAIGDWTSVNAEKFPERMRASADEIHAAGKRAGLWVAPFGARADSQLAQQHPEFLLRGLDDAPVLAWTHWNEPVYALDLTRPDVQAWLRALFTTVCFEWGYDAVKLDFVFAGALPGQPYDPTLTRAQAYRRGLEVIADTLGPDKIILGCGAPQLASLGLVDTMRVSQDVNFTWAAGDSANTGAVSTQNAVQNTLLRAPLNQHWWLNDPDCVIVRQYGDLNAMTRHETRTLASVAALTGSILLDSDNLTTVNPAYLVDLRRILPPLDRTAHVRRWFADTVEQPAELELAVGGGRMVLAVINWSDQPRPAMVSLASEDWHHVYDFWSKKYLGLHRERVKLPRCAPHETKVLQCARLTNEAQVIATSFHIAAADLAQVTQTKSGLQIVASGTPDLRGEILIQLPPRARNHRIWCNGKRARSVALGPRVIAVRFKSQARTRIELEY